MTDDHSRDHRHGNGWATFAAVLLVTGILLAAITTTHIAQWIGATS